tara:strand:+ start:665 stop:1366 length:702 start_codon:yes stop_codon:yes gene_type:complete
MALPKLNTQTFELNVPSTDEKVKFRPFLVKEEKILLQAQEGGQKEMFDALADVVKECTFNKIDIERLPSFDVEYMFLKIRAKSVGEKVSLNLPFPGDEKVKVPTQVNLMKVEVEVGDNHTNKFDLTDNVSVVMQYPTLKTFVERDYTKLSAEDAVALTASCIHQVINGVETFEARDLSKKELNEFVENMTQEQFSKIQAFFNTMPKLSHTVTLTHPKTKKRGKVKLEGMQSFF